MRPIDPAELSAFIDGELDTQRTGEVRTALAADEALRARYEALAQADAHLRSLAAGAHLHPRIRWPSPAASAAAPVPSGLWRALPVVLIPATWLFGKLTDADALALAASAVAFLTLVVSAVTVVLNEEEAPALPENLERLT
jgi:anti-sigma factor RsiW